MGRNTVLGETLERLNFLYLCEQFPEEMARHAGHATCKKLCVKYGAEIDASRKRRGEIATWLI